MSIFQMGTLVSLAFFAVFPAAIEFALGSRAFFRAMMSAVVAGGAILIFHWFTGSVLLVNTTHWLDLFTILVVDAIISVIVFGTATFVANANHNNTGGGLVTIVVVAIVGLLIFVGADTFVVPPTFCADNTNTDRLASLIALETNPAERHDTDADALIRVTPTMAFEAATRAMPAELGTYLAVNQAQLQEVAGEDWYIVDLKVTDWFAFTRRGAVVPGYFRVNAHNDAAVAEFMGGYQMKYVPGLSLLSSKSLLTGFDLKRHVHHIALDGNWRLDDLETLEIRDDWVPFYTAALLSSEVGNKGYIVDSYLIVNPQDGTHEIFDVSHATNSLGEYEYDTTLVPEWVDRIFSVNLLQEYLTWWGQYEFHEERCIGADRGEQYQVEAVGGEDVFTQFGHAIQFTLTSTGTDETLNYLVYIDPRTGQGSLFKLENQFASPTLAVIQQNMLAVIKSQSGSAEFSVDELEFQWLRGRRVVYAIATSAGTDNFAGVVIVQVKDTMTNSKYIYAPSVEEAYAQLARQIATENNEDGTISEQADPELQVQGVIDRIGSYINSDGRMRVIFTLLGTEVITPTTMFEIDADSNTALLRTGDIVTITALDAVEPNETNQVLDVRVDGWAQ